MPIDVWLRQITTTGRVRLAAPTTLDNPKFDDIQIQTALEELDASARLEAPHTPPDLSLPCAFWAARLLYQASQCLVYRYVPAEIVRDVFAELCPQSVTPSVFYSVDLTFRYLPDLLALARGLAENDPLVEGLIELARAWPYSSVGIKQLGKFDSSAFIHHPSLRRTYADRIIDRNDTARLNDPLAAEAVRECLGGFPELASTLARSLNDGNAVITTNG